MLDNQQIQSIIPHRPPFLLVDRILEVEDGVRAVGIKNVTINEPFFQGHFPGFPVMPGVLIVEALAQVGGIAILKMKSYEGKIGMFAGIDGVRFRGQVVPGDTIVLEATITRLKSTVAKMNAVAKVDGNVVCEGELMFAMVDAAASQ